MTQKGSSWIQRSPTLDQSTEGTKKENQSGRERTGKRKAEDGAQQEPERDR